MFKQSQIFPFFVYLSSTTADTSYVRYDRLGSVAETAFKPLYFAHENEGLAMFWCQLGFPL